MFVLGIDPGAKRAGWAVLDNWGHGKPPGPSFVDAGIIECPRLKSEAYQEYRVRLTEFWMLKMNRLIYDYTPDLVVCEIVPAYGMSDPGQGYLANVMATTVHLATISFYHTDRPDPPKFEFVSASKPQYAVGIKGKAKRMTKANVRKGVIKIFPELKRRLMRNSKIFEESDAICLALWGVNTFPK